MAQIEEEMNSCLNQGKTKNWIFRDLLLLSVFEEIKRTLSTPYRRERVSTPRTHPIYITLCLYFCHFCGSRKHSTAVLVFWFVKQWMAIETPVSGRYKILDRQSLNLLPRHPHHVPRSHTDDRWHTRLSLPNVLHLCLLCRAVACRDDEESILWRRSDVDFCRNKGMPTRIRKWRRRSPWRQMHWSGTPPHSPDLWYKTAASWSSSQPKA